MIQAIKGTKDILPAESPLWQYVENILSKIAKGWQYTEIRTPVFEDTALFSRSIGEETDIVGKEMYSFSTTGGDALTLRPEGTAGVARAFIQNNFDKQGGVERLWYAGAMFRHERPQKGRQRQFHQFGAELYGSPFPEADIEVIALAWNILTGLGLQSVSLQINSIGSAESRTRYKQALVDYLQPFAEQLSEESRRRLLKNPLRILDSKNPQDIALLQQAPDLRDMLSPEDTAAFQEVLSGLEALNIPYQINSRLVRGLDYYNNTVFEFVTDRLGSQNAVLSGGRYDNLIQQLGGRATPAIGFALGMERILMLMAEEGVLPNTTSGCDIFGIAFDPIGRVKLQQLFVQLRQQGYTCSSDVLRRSMKAQLREADRMQARFALILGEDEVQQGMVTLKDLRRKEQNTIAFESVVAAIESSINQPQHPSGDNVA